MKKTTRIAVIPARGGSTRLKNKNIHPLGGKPLIRWTVEAVIESGCFEKVIVSTDSDLIFDAVSDLPVSRHMRPDEHATVRATALNAMLDLMKNSIDKYDVFSYFLPTCPFIDPSDIKAGADKLTEETDFVVSMTQIPETIQLACVMKNGWVLPVFDNLEAGLTNSKFIKKYYKPSGAFYMGRWDKILQNKNFFKGSVKGVLIPPERSVDINNIQDIQFAESILSNRCRL
ncbi:acylneuraminate cytidylyltransferase family protein [Candidatus Pelagibacter bacterium]|nr:acylneuraminate cytidylyltransferase family protein [Candidatus Pelagibacter bacterium]